MSEEKRYSIADFSAIAPVECPCGLSRRAYIEASGGNVSFHLLDVKIDAQLHYHKEHTEISSNSAGSALARAAASGYFRNNSGVTVLTFLSVH